MPFTQQQLEDAYDQMKQERADDAAFAVKAADKLAKALGHQYQVQSHDDNWSWSHGAITPQTTLHTLVLQLCQYDDWQACYNALVAAGVTMNPWGGTYHPAPEGAYDVSTDATFAGRPIQQYKVRIDYVDSGPY